MLISSESSSGEFRLWWQRVQGVTCQSHLPRGGRTAHRRAPADVVATVPRLVHGPEWAAGGPWVDVASVGLQENVVRSEVALSHGAERDPLLMYGGDPG